MKPSLTGLSLMAAGLMLALNACGPQSDDVGTFAVPGKALESSPPSPAEALSSEEPVSTLTHDLGSALGSPVTASNTCGEPNQFTPSCAFSAAPDKNYVWTAPSSGTFRFTTSGSDYDTVLHIYNRVTGAPLGCNDDAMGTLQSALELPLSAGQQLRIVVDGFSSACGGFHLNIASANPGDVVWESPNMGQGSNALAWLTGDTDSRSTSTAPPVLGTLSPGNAAACGRAPMRSHGSLAISNAAAEATSSSPGTTTAASG